MSHSTPLWAVLWPKTPKIFNCASFGLFSGLCLRPAESTGRLSTCKPQQLPLPNDDQILLKYNNTIKFLSFAFGLIIICIFSKDIIILVVSH